MKRMVCLLLSCLFLFLPTTFAETSFDVSSYSLTELIEIRALVDEKINELTSQPSNELVPGKYLVGRDIAAGSYIIHGLMDKGPNGYTPQALIADSMEQTSYSQYRSYEYIENNEKWFLNLASENVLEIRSGTVSIEQAPLLICSIEYQSTDEIETSVSSTLVPGIYTVGKDIIAGDYILQGLMDKGPAGYTPQVLIAESMTDAQYNDYNEYEYLKKSDLWRVHIEDGNILEVRSGDVCIQDIVPLSIAPSKEELKETDSPAENKTDITDKTSVIKGVYSVGRDIMPGSYAITLTDCIPSTVIASFATADDLTAYTSWNSANNLKEYGKTAVYTKKDVPVHITLEDGDFLYISDGQGFISENTSDTIMKGIYVAGRDIQPGAYTISLSGVSGSAVVATFSNINDTLSYVTWDSGNNLKEYGKTAVYASPDIPIHIYLEQGDCLYIAEGNGTISNYTEGTLTKGVYCIGKDLQPGSYLITLNDFYYSATVATFATNKDLVSYISWDSANNLKEYSAFSLNVKKGDTFHITLIDGEYLYISDGIGNYTIQQ